MKCIGCQRIKGKRPVTLHARVWIEIRNSWPEYHGASVTLHARVWIEMKAVVSISSDWQSHPPREGVD